MFRAITFVALLFFAQSAWACPDFRLNGTALSYTASQLYSPQTVSAAAGGNVDLANCMSIPGLGHVMRAPDFTMSYHADRPMQRLEIRTNTGCDSILLVNLPNGTWLYDDDSNGALDAKISVFGPQPGTYDIWVGTRYGGYCAGTMTLETF
ncbi:serine protease Do [Ectothiorhodosinus mongolicus]|uniref:Serine protease Do n=1 Tax=Ectothiorhodosinus mongolicus TaxID=233100 RepID=A0A1R3VMY0_9GAMM|nr:hypothetical protein [Ectothiorhodosinus mongolicus]ULX56414.1 hypothetical protein CKX93_01040 [Ectothiorhodosinus mongolicus]SIT65938.1 serine protease Do [Ectothiorhodosinus mongolicus]